MVHRKGVYHYGRKTRHHSQRNGGIFEHCPDEKAARRVADTIKIIEHESNNYVMNADGTGDYSISKSAFVNAICEEKDSFKGFSFDEFQKIFDVINSIVSSSKE